MSIKRNRGQVSAETSARPVLAVVVGVDTGHDESRIDVRWAWLI
jgi:hypothetical protein